MDRSLELRNTFRLRRRVAAVERPLPFGRRTYLGVLTAGAEEVRQKRLDMAQFTSGWMNSQQTITDLPSVVRTGRSVFCSYVAYFTDRTATCTATELVQAGTQQTNACLEITENPLNKPNYRT